MLGCPNRLGIWLGFIDQDFKTGQDRAFVDANLNINQANSIFYKYRKVVVSIGYELQACSFCLVIVQIQPATFPQVHLQHQRQRPLLEIEKEITIIVATYQRCRPYLLKIYP